ncbi:MAG TPA: FlgD immunoglobulin-like domain containing protein, partial [Tepidisphaeraceae bacterium]
MTSFFTACCPLPTAHYLRCFLVVAIAATLLANSSVALAQGGRGRHERAFAVSRPGDVKIDAKLDDWDLSGQIWIYVSQETSEQKSAKFAMMYDDEALYLSGDVRDPTPMMNRHDPKVSASKAWDADAFQFRIILDPAQGFPVSQHLFTNTPNDALIHMLLWYFTDRQEACLQVQKSMDYLPIENGLPDGVVPPDKFQAAYRKSDDGRGYVFEYRIPYATLGVGAAGGAKVHPKAGNLVPGTLQFLWSNPNGMSTSGIDGWAYDLMDKPGFGYQDSGCWGKVIFSPKGKLPREQVEAGVAAEPKLPLTFEFDLPQDGQVTIALADENGQMVRNLLASSPRRAGRVVERWDGLDDSGHVLPAGKYTWRGLYHQGIGVEFVLSVHNSGQPPFKTDDETGGWDGDHGMPRAACAAGEKMLLSWNSAESGWGIIGTDLAGKKQWGIRQCAEYLASDGKRFFAVGGHSFYEGEEVRVFDVTDGRPLNFESGSPLLPYPEGGDKKNNTVTGLVYGAGRIYASYGLRDLVAAYDGKRGTLLATWKVPSPQRLAFLGADAGGDALAVVSQDKIVRLVAGKSEPLIGDHLDQPRGIAVDPDGTFYVANAGKLQDVSVFDKTGKFLRSIGKPGGRPRIGHYDASGMLEPGGIAIDNKGQLWVTETLDAPKRISVWNSATGEFANEFFGGSAYSTPISMDPKHPDEVYTHSVLWKIDWEKKTGRPVSTIWRALNGDSIAEVGNTLMNQFFPFTAKNGRQYAWTYQFPKGWALFMRDGDIFKPLLMMFYLEDGNPLAPWPPYALMGDIKRYPKGSYVWVDANDDQTMQHEEIK